MNTADITFVPVKPRRKHDSPNMKLWAVMCGGKVIFYTDEPETYAADLPRVNSFDYQPTDVRSTPLYYEDLLCTR